MSQIQKYNMWKDHFNDMIKGEILPNQGVVIVKGKKNSQVGMGLRLVAATEQFEHINTRKKPRKKHSSVKRLAKNIKKTKKKATVAKKSKKKPVKRRKR